MGCPRVFPNKPKRLASASSSITTSHLRIFSWSSIPNVCETTLRHFTVPCVPELCPSPPVRRVHNRSLWLGSLHSGVPHEAKSHISSWLKTLTHVADRVSLPFLHSLASCFFFAFTSTPAGFGPTAGRFFIARYIFLLNLDRRLRIQETPAVLRTLTYQATTAIHNGLGRTRKFSGGMPPGHFQSRNQGHKRRQGTRA